MCVLVYGGKGIEDFPRENQSCFLIARLYLRVATGMIVIAYYNFLTVGNVGN